LLMSQSAHDDCRDAPSTARSGGTDKLTGLRWTLTISDAGNGRPCGGGRCVGRSRLKAWTNSNDYGKRKIRTVFGRVEVSDPRIINCRRCLPYFSDASAVLRDICPDRATPELMDLSARMGGLMPYRKAADVLAEFLPIPSTESFMIRNVESASNEHDRREGRALRRPRQGQTRFRRTLA